MENKERRRHEWRIQKTRTRVMLPVPEVEPDRKESEIPPDKDAPEKKGPMLAEG
jgi:hypothetical protein